MDNLTKLLYNFVQEKEMGGLWRDPEYREAVKSVELQTEKVRQSMTGEQRRELRFLLEEMSAQSTIESEHLFRAALRLAGGLTSLLRR